MKQYKTFFVVNPRAGHGQGLKTWTLVQRLLDKQGFSYAVDFTDAQGHAMLLTTDALQRGFEMVVAVGGDGTVNEVVNGFFDDKRKPLAPEAVLGLLPAGTGCDLVRSLNYPKKMNDRIQQLWGVQTRKVDLGHVAYQSLDGLAQERYFINIAGCGLSGTLVDQIGKVTRRFGSTIAYALGTLKAMHSYEPCHFTVQVDGAAPITKRSLLAVLANGQFFGSGMHIAPEAAIDDGWFDFVWVGDIGPLELIANLPRVYRGQLRKHPRVEVYRAKQVKISAERQVLLDVDGEQPGMLPATFSLLPKAIRLKCT